MIYFSTDVYQVSTCIHIVFHLASDISYFKEEILCSGFLLPLRKLIRQYRSFIRVGILCLNCGSFGYECAYNPFSNVILQSMSYLFWFFRLEENRLVFKKESLSYVPSKKIFFIFIRIELTQYIIIRPKRIFLIKSITCCISVEGLSCIYIYMCGCAVLRWFCIYLNN